MLDGVWFVLGDSKPRMIVHYCRDESKSFGQSPHSVHVTSFMEVTCEAVTIGVHAGNLMVCATSWIPRRGK